MRLISSGHLPNASLRSIGIVSKDDIFALETYIKRRPRAYIHNDGGLVRFFRMPKIEIAPISKIIKTMPLGSALQIYRYHEKEIESYYMSIRKDIDYTNILPKHLFNKFSLNPERKSIVKVYEETNKAFDQITQAIEGCSLEETEYTESLLPKTLIDCAIQGHDIKLPSIRANLSYLKVGPDRYATIGSVNNMSVIPKAKGCLSGQQFLQRIIVVIPNEERMDALKKATIDNGNMIKALSNEAAKNRTVHVDTITMDRSVEGIVELRGKICYADASFFLFDKTTEELEKNFKGIYDALEKHNVAMYCHTNTSRAAYTTFFPGNESYGERYSILFEYFLNIFMQNVLEL